MQEEVTESTITVGSIRNGENQHAENQYEKQINSIPPTTKYDTKSVQIDFYTPLCLKTAEYTFFSISHGTFSKRDHIPCWVLMHTGAPSRATKIHL